MSKPFTTEEFIKQCIKVHGLNYDYSKTVYSTAHENIIVICPFHGEFKQNAFVHKKGHGCPKCSNCYKKTQKEFIEECNKVHNNKYDYSLVEYKNNKTKVKIICPIDNHGMFEQSASHHLHRKQGCPKCKLITITEKATIPTEEFFERCNKIHNNKYDYSLTKFVKLNANVEIICPDHGSFIQRANHHIRGAGCPLCTMSRGEKSIKHFLERNNIKYEIEYKFDDLVGMRKRKLKFDFYLKDYNLCIEFQGRQHYEPISHFGGDLGLKTNKERDQVKKDYCISHNINLLEIPYWDFKNIETILKTALHL
jgi:protein-arginine kinase activator protein McsA